MFSTLKTPVFSFLNDSFALASVTDDAFQEGMFPFNLGNDKSSQDPTQLRWGEGREMDQIWPVVLASLETSPKPPLVLA